jgi:hypothetical protein
MVPNRSGELQVEQYIRKINRRWSVKRHEAIKPINPSVRDIYVKQYRVFMHMALHVIRMTAS